MLGDWVDEAYPLAAARFFASAETVAVELRQASAVAPTAPPTADAAQDAEMDALLQAAPSLRADFGPKVQAARADLLRPVMPLERGPLCHCPRAVVHRAPVAVGDAAIVAG